MARFARQGLSMIQQEAMNSAWQHFWQLLLEAPLPAPPPPVAPISVPLDDEFDFLAEPAAPPSAKRAPDSAVPDPQRLAQLAGLESVEAELVAALTQQFHTLRDDPRLDRVDAAGALWLCRLLVQGPVASLPEHGPLLRLLQRAARSPDPALVALAADAIGHLDARAAQLDLVARLHANPRSLGHDGVDRVLACLKTVADGRCVREMEALLVERGAELSDVHAWQARHIVQVIRRSGRK